MKWLVVLLAFIASSAFADVTAKAYIITDMEGHVLLEKNADEIRSIASITKLITTRSSAAYDQNELIVITEDDVKAGRMRSSPLKAGLSYTRGQLTNLALVSSDNIAAIALGRTLSIPPTTLPQGVHWVEGSGLDPQNVASARDLAEIARTLVNSDLARMSVMPSITINDRERKSTNPLIGKPGWTFELSKTGFINQAGGCVVSIFESGGRKLVAVVLGSRNVPERWRDLFALRKQVDPDSVFASPGGVLLINPSRRLGSRIIVTIRKHRYN